MSNVVDIPAIIQVIGGIYKNPSFLENENYFFSEEDFTEEFHQILFGAMYNIHALGAKEITINAIEDYLKESVPRDTTCRMPWHDVHIRLEGPI